MIEKTLTSDLKLLHGVMSYQSFMETKEDDAFRHSVGTILRADTPLTLAPRQVAHN